MAEESEPTTSSEPVRATRAADLPVLVVGLCASAGGLDSIQEFFTALDEGAGMAFIVNQPAQRHESAWIELLQKFTTLPVHPLGDGVRLAPDHVYVAPAPNTFRFESGVARRQPNTGDGELARAPLDRFLMNLAEAFGPRTVGVIMSSTDVDGTVGIDRVSSAGGMTMAKGLDHATHDTSPRPSMATAAVDHVLRPSEMAQMLLAYARRVVSQNDDDSLLPVERELASTRSDLENTIGALEALNEELKRSNEKLLSMNEELQSANEELETSKEEVQQVNRALARAHANLSNLLTSTQIATIFLDDDLRIQSFTPAVTEIYNVIQSDIGRPLAHITHGAQQMPELPRPEALHRDGGVREDEVEMPDGRRFLRRTLPYRTHEGRHEGLVMTFVEVTELKQAEEKARRHQRQLQMITDALPVLISYVDSEYRYHFNNQTYERWFGLPASTLYGKHMREVIGAEAFAMLQPTLERVAAGEIGNYEGTLPYRSGGERSVRGQYVPDRGPDGRVRGFFAVIHDSSELEKAASVLAEAKSAAEQANRAKSEFLANMSHEIRTPISAILGYAELLTNHVRDPDDLASVGAIKRNGQYLIEIINDILDLSKIEARMLRAERIRFSPHAALRDAVDALRGRAVERGLPLRLHYDGPLPETVESDPTRLRQILLNLVGNALKFTNHGSVEVRARLLPDERIEVCVTDTGIGISNEQQARLFEPFTQGDSSVTRQYGGTGLGLAISKRLVELLGGQLSVESKIGEGSTFRFTVTTGPLEGVPLVEAAPARSEPPPAAGSRLIGFRVLVVDDRPDMRYLMQTYLEEAEAEVVAVGDGASAVRRVRTAATDGEPFRAVLLDMQMPGMDGYAVARQLRDGGYRGRIIAVTANAMKGDREACLTAGCDDYLPKPVDRIALLNSVARAPQLEASRPISDTAPRRSRPRVLVVDDSEDATFVLGQLLETRGFDVSAAHDGAEAIELAARIQPHAVVLDIGLPDLDGFEVVERMKAHAALADTRYIALSGRNLTDEQRAAFHAHFVKPADLDRLVVAIEPGKS